MTTRLVLSGIRVLDLTELLPGPLATQMLADMGADIIKIERPKVGDNFRNLRPGTFRVMNRGKQSVTLDLKSKAGRDVLIRLAKTADILVEGYRPGAMQRLDLGYEALKAVNESIIYASISGFGQTGPLRDFPGHDINYVAVSGVLSMCGRSDHPEHAIGVPVADLSGSMYTVTSILAALLLRKETGKGQYLDVSLTDTVMTMVGPRLGLTKTDVLHRAGNNVYETKDKRYIAVGALEDQFWARLAKVLCVPVLADPRYKKAHERWKHSDYLDAIIQDKMRERTHDEWIQILNDNDVPTTTINDSNTLFDNPQLKSRGMFLEGKGLRYFSYPVRMQGVDSARNSTSSELGQDTENVLASAGYTAEEIAGMKEQGVI